jgi:hypothetical protein
LVVEVVEVLLRLRLLVVLEEEAAAQLVLQQVVQEHLGKVIKEAKA